MLTYVLSVALAAAAVAFAAYKVVKLNGMEDPPANLGLNFPPPKRKFIIDQALAQADPIITRTLAPARGASQSAEALSGSARTYGLLAVIDGVAFVEMSLARGKTLVPVTVGTLLPGGLRVESIERQDGRWVLIAGPVRVEEAENQAQ